MSKSILRLQDVMKKTGLSRASIYQRIANGTFPKQVPLGVRAVGWVDTEVDAWISEQIKKGGK